VKFIGVGEKLDALEEFRRGHGAADPGQGDILGLVQDAMTKFDQDEIAAQQAKLEKGTFTLTTSWPRWARCRSSGHEQGDADDPGMGEMTRT
jgi:signal recognition particle GTPase